MEQHDIDKLKKEEANEQRQHEENELFKSIEPYIDFDGINRIINAYPRFSSMSKAETAEYVRDTLANLIIEG